jgi:hypothetical protein
MSTPLVITWTKPIPTLAVALRGWRERLLAAIEKVCTIVAARMQATAQDTAPWTDRTGNARQGLTARFMRLGTVFVLVLFHTMDYGKWLELANNGRYAVILKTMQAEYPRLMAMIMRLFR